MASGEKGLRQSDALFSHVKALPEVIGEVSAAVSERLGGGYKIAAVGVSDSPRNVPGSYMPCFLAGVSAASSTAGLFRVPLYRFSHQEGHIEAALFGAGHCPSGSFYSFHLSGGTCELLRVESESAGVRRTASIVSKTLDITCGQLIDRCGVALGLLFPCGAGLEKLAMESVREFKIKPAVFPDGINISGFENKFLAMLNTSTPSDAAKFVFDAVFECIRAMLGAIPPSDSNTYVVFAGGVMSSSLIKARLIREFPSAASSGRFLFAPPALSSDNAAGIALLARKADMK
ncbi:tRNA N6-adenosine threonylcarbamoyltransferase [bioreactor metagenome]|uniref:N(6)-L-threonylcarbamoyladenine synthase n=1 Tax=bioreactor metagenome TaxID=1076179 RepID=A0A645D770_9ZZZZ